MKQLVSQKSGELLKRKYKFKPVQTSPIPLTSPRVFGNVPGHLHPAAATGSSVVTCSCACFSMYVCACGM